MSKKLTYFVAVFGILLNILGGIVSKFYNLPVFLDNFGTILSAFLLGPAGGVITGLFTNLILGVTIDPIYIPFTIVNVVIGFVFGYVAIKHGRNFTSMIIHSFLITIIALSLIVPIKIYFFGGPIDPVISLIALTYVDNRGIDLFLATYIAEFPLILAEIMLSALWGYLILMILPKKMLKALKVDTDEI
ncbi:conserved hypothetical protein [Methanococcus vannielii SB]|uniref:Signal transduction histidine kinase, LytS n=1 Tax=Methanococcus vannielii (strain ATCC 35089 / DSM 1224 / JCM 13029 / OCM 148 / SB) TaxID=406327 RepID=A6USD2_METVS|nr:hypothetical protein [Methanococcus vannielii]ABR55404.1 conserved hypothetical protein [Methanococcus vannielii SB]